MRKEIAPRLFVEELDREYFMILVRFDCGRYEILNDLYFVKELEATSDEDAIRQFREYVRH
jgi:hypothetical protein